MVLNNHQMVQYLFFFILFSSTLYAQLEQNYIPYSNDDTKTCTNYTHGVTNQYSKDLASIEGKYKTPLKEEYTKRYKEINHRLENKEFFCNQSLNDYSNQILQKILAANPELFANKKYRLLIGKYAWANAFTFGEGTLVVNMGLIRRLESEGELAFVICHELAHNLLNHVNDRMKKYIEFTHSRETQQKLREISRSTYNKTKKAMDLLENVIFDNRKHSRTNESEADSLALVLLKNTNYKPAAAISCLEKLDHADIEKYRDKINYATIFNFENYPFKNNWVEEEISMVGFFQEEEDTERLDSLKTHPDCTKRIRQLQPTIQQIDQKNKADFLVSENSFLEIVQRSDFEIIEGEMEMNLIDQALFHALQLLIKYPHNVFLHRTIGQGLFQLSKARAAHDFSYYVNQKSDIFEDQFNEHLVFLNNLEEKELMHLAFYYLEKNEPKEHATGDYLYLFGQTAKALNKTETYNRILKLYKEKFPNGDSF